MIIGTPLNSSYSWLMHLCRLKRQEDFIIKPFKSGILKFILNLKLIFLFIILTGQVFSQSYNYRNFNSEDGLVGSYVYSISQDNRGYLWIGTDNGLSKYNGFTFQNFTTNDSLADNYITCSINDGDALWFGHRNGRLSYYNGRKFQPIDIPGSSMSPVTHFAKSPDGRIWVSTYTGTLLRLSNNTGEEKQYFFKDEVSLIKFEFLDQDDFLAGTNTGLLYCRLNESGQIEIISLVTDIPESKITGIQKIKNTSGFYVATENEGIFEVNHKDGKFIVSKLLVNHEIELSGIQAIYQDSRSVLWLASFGKGLIKLGNSASDDSVNILALSKISGFTSDNIKTVFEDREGNIWSGNYGEGLTQITPKTFSVKKFDNPLYGNNVFSIWFDKEYRWIGTENGFLKMDQKTGKVIRFYSMGTGFIKDTVTAIYSATGNEIWIGTEKNGLFRMNTGNEKIIKYALGVGSLENSVNIITGKGEQVWVGTKKGLCNINSLTDSIKWYDLNRGGLPHNYINCIYLDKRGKLWVTTRSSTLAYIMDGKVFKVPLNSISRISTLGPVTEDPVSRIWVGSNGNGVFMIESDSITNITSKEGLLSNYCYSIVCDDNNNLWIGHKGGLSRIRTMDYMVKPVQHIETTTDSYQFNPNAILKDQQQRIWFGSDKGLVSYDPSMEYPLTVPPVLGITSLKINDEETDSEGEIILSPGNYKIRIDFIGISLKEPALVSYQYQLEGYDHLSEITKTPAITYNNLTEGEYTFILRASSGDGAISENPLTIHFIIQKPIWKNWWFYVIVVFLLSMLAFSYIKRREVKFIAEKKILEEKVIERTFEIQTQKNEIELQRDLIDEKNNNITASIEYASHIQKAVLPPVELLDELLPDNFILSKPKDIVSGDFYWMTERDNKIIFAVADCTGHGVPGAFMSVLGITLLNSIVNLQGFTSSEVIVTKLHDGIIQSLKQGREYVPTNDGIDIVLCVLDKQTGKIQFTGDMNDLVYIRDRKLKVVKANRLSVCFDNSDPFVKNEFEYKKGDIYYLFSDGYKDQFGGKDDRKYMSCQLYAKLMEIHELPMSGQKEILDAEITEWMKNTDQTDDITVMGVRL